MRGSDGIFADHTLKNITKLIDPSFSRMVAANPEMRGEKRSKSYPARKLLWNMRQEVEAAVKAAGG
jgi:hypothetical protein